MKKNKIIYALDFLIITGSAFLLIMLTGYTQPLVIGPIDNFETSESVLFTIEKADKILIDKDIGFSNPKIYYAEDGLDINLEPGEYYWKAEGISGIETEIRKLTILSKIDLRLRQTSEGYEIANSGNVRLNVDVYDDENYLESFKLAPMEEKQTRGDKFFGGWNEN
jgi:hypothetical protein